MNKVDSKCGKAKESMGLEHKMHAKALADWQKVRRIAVLTDKDIQTLFIRYPNGVNKEIFRKICHLSPRVAQYLLESGLVPCKIRPQRTHRYSITTADMVEFLRDREKRPEKYGLPSEKYSKYHRSHVRSPNRPSDIQLSLITDISYNEACRNAISDCPDLLSIAQTITVIGYSSKKIMRWYREKKLVCVNIRGKILVPKLALYEFMLTEDFRKIKVKSNRQWELLKNAIPKFE